jgi:hypothetical protein
MALRRHDWHTYSVGISFTSIGKLLGRAVVALFDESCVKYFVNYKTSSIAFQYLCKAQGLEQRY